MAIPTERKHREQLSFIENPKEAGEVDRRVHDVCANDKLDTLIGLQGGSTGTPFRLFNRIVSTPGVSQVMLAQTVPASETLTLKLIRLVCRRSGSYIIKVDGNIIGSGKVGPSKLVDNFIFYIDEILTEAQTVSVEFTAISGEPAVDVDVHLQALTN